MLQRMSPCFVDVALMDLPDTTVLSGRVHI